MQQLYRSTQAKLFAATLILLLLPVVLQAQESIEGIVRIKVSESLANRLQQSRMSLGSSGEVVTGIASLDAMNRQFHVRKLRRVFPPAGKNEARHRRHGLHLWYEMTLNKNIPVSHVIQSYQSEKQILRAEPVYQKKIVGADRPDFGPRVLRSTRMPLSDASDDPLLGNQWHYHNTGQTGGVAGSDIKLFEAWKVETGNPQVVIAVTDGGIQTDHPDLAANMWVNPGEIGGNNIDDDNNGYVDDVHGYGFVNNSSDILPHDHGTHVAGTLAAVSNNATGVAGVAGGSGSGDGVRLMSCAVFAYDSVPDGFAEAYVYAADNGAVISQNSWGYTWPGVFEQVVLDAIDYFIEEAGKNAFGQQVGPMNGGLAVFSAGNFNDGGNYYPSYYEPVIAVASTTHRDTRAYYSNYGDWVDISAPGGETDPNEAEGVISTLTGSQYGSFMGTSMACPHVSGVAALIVSKYAKEGLRPDAVRTRILMSVDDISARNPSYAGQLGSGRLNAAIALRQGNTTGPEAITDLVVLGTDVGEITIGWTSPRDLNDFVAEYDLRYSTTPITASNFNAATRIAAVPAPSAPGKAERFTVTNLQGGIKFYFAVRSLDFEGNASSLSNVVSQVSALTPVIAVTPPIMEEHLQTAQQSTRTLQIENEGEGPLKFAITIPDDDNTLIVAQPAEGQVPPGGVQSITVGFDAAGKLEGTFRLNLVINCNDPSASSVTVPITVTVTRNGVPIASVDPASHDFKSVQVGQTAFRTIQVHNAGSEPLIIDKVSADIMSFHTVAAIPFAVAPFQTVDLRIGFTPDKTGPVTGKVTLSTNDPANSTLTVAVQGEGLNEAPISVTPAYFNETLEKGTRVTRNLVLRNNGSQSRTYRLEATNNRLVKTTTALKNGTARKQYDRDANVDLARTRKLKAHQERFASSKSSVKLAQPFRLNRGSTTSTARAAMAYKRELRQYETGFENFTTGPIGEQQGWFATQGWAVSQANPDAGVKHFRGISQVSGAGEQFCISPYIFEADEFYYPQYTSASMRLNLDNARGTTWEVVPQDPWSYVATRLRFNADRTLDALVIGNEYDAHWRRVPVQLPQGYFDLTVEYNNAGSDTSGFPTYFLFINNQHVFSGTGLASGIGQLAFVSPMETSGPMLDADDIRVIGGEYVAPFVKPSPTTGTLSPGQSVAIAVEFDASIMKYGTYESDLLVHLDETDTIKVPVTVNIPGSPSLWRDTYSIFMVLEKNEVGYHQVYLKNNGGETVTFEFDHDIPGLTITPPSGSLEVREDGFIDVKFDGLPGMYSDSIFIRTNISPQADFMPVNITKFDSGAVFSALDTLRIQVVAGNVSSDVFTLSNKGANTVSYTSEVSSELTEIIQLSPASATIGGSPLNVRLNVDASQLSPGTTTGLIRFRTNDPDRRNFYTHVVLTAVPEAPQQGIVREVWTNISGPFTSAIPLNAPPAYTEQLTAFESPSNTGDNYGARIRGYIQPPTSGLYAFFIASNDHSELWLSTDEREGNKRMIASVTGYTNPRQWRKYASQASAEIYLEANRKYYIEAIHKEGVGTDHLSVAWRLPDNIFEVPIPAARVLPYEAEVECSASGTITRELWTRVSGGSIADIPVNSTPHSTEVLTLFEGPVNAGTNYGARIRGYICPPQTGNYSFWIASNDASELWLSTDEDPLNKRQIAYLGRATGYREWQRFATQKSSAIFLVQGKTYYIEALHKQGVGTDHLSVGWQLPDGTFERPIAGSRLSPFQLSPTPGMAEHDAPAFMTADGTRDLRIYPNPVENEMLNIELNRAAKATTTAEGEIVIRDITGISVYTGKIQCSEGCRTAIDIEDTLTPGVYLIQVSSGKNKYVERLIVR